MKLCDIIDVTMLGGNMNGKSEEVYYSEKPADDIVHHRRDRSGHAADLLSYDQYDVGQRALDALFLVHPVLCELFLVAAADGSLCVPHLL